MLKEKDRVFTNFIIKDSTEIDLAIKRGDYDGTLEILKKNPDEIIDIVKASCLRGRGGAGFSTGMKWSFMPKNPTEERPNYLVINADESEPGTCKDRDILRYEPHKLIEGIIIASHAMRVKKPSFMLEVNFIMKQKF